MSYTAKNYIGDSGAAPANNDASCELAGMRVQLMKVLSYVHQGASLVYRLRTEYLGSEAQRMLDEYVTQNHNWLGDEVEPLLVPGTFCPEAIGTLLMRFGWVRPDDADEPSYMRNFVLSESGEKALEGANAWWNSLSWSQKAWLYVVE